MSATDVHEQVHEREAARATQRREGSDCGCDCESIGCCGEEPTALAGIEVERSHAVPDGMHGTIARAHRPA